MHRALAIALGLGVLGLGSIPVASSEETPVSIRPGYDLPLSPISQENAVNAAEDYIRMGPFSLKGLIEQLEYEGYSTADAAYAATHINVDWNQQAARAAKEYLEMSPFSQSGLLEQLEYEGFTPAQAAYGVRVAYR